MPRQRPTHRIAFHQRMPVRLARLHFRLLISIAFGAAVTLLLAASGWRLTTRLLAGWDAGVALYLVLAYFVIAQAPVAMIRRRAAIQDEGAAALLALTACAAVATLAAIVVELASAQTGDGSIQLAIGIATLPLSWLFMHTIFALHYAHEYYGERADDQTGGLKFPGTHPPDYWDFLYFSFVVAMTSQVSDVAITSKVIRRLVNAHGVLSFFFNVTVLALAINIVSSLVKPG